MALERSRLRARRLLLLFLAAGVVVLAVDIATLPGSMNVVWTYDPDGLVTGVSGYRDPTQGEVVVLALREEEMHDPYATYSHFTRLVLIDGEGRRIGVLGEALDTWVNEILCLPDREDPSVVIASSLYTADPALTVYPEIGRLPEFIYEWRGRDESFTPAQLDLETLRDGSVLVVGFNTYGPGGVVVYRYNNSLVPLWGEYFPLNEVVAKIMPVTDPRILVLGSGLVYLYTADGSRIKTLNLTDLVISRSVLGQGGEEGGVWTSIRHLGSALGDRLAVIYFCAHLREQDRNLYFVAVVDEHLDVLSVWREGDWFSRPRLVGFDESRIVEGDRCLNLDGSVSWIRAGLSPIGVADVDGDGLEEVVSAKRTLLGWRIQVFEQDGEVTASGIIGHTPSSEGLHVYRPAGVSGPTGTMPLIYGGHQITAMVLTQRPGMLRLGLGIVAILVLGGLLLGVLHGTYPWGYRGLTGKASTVRVKKRLGRDRPLGGEGWLGARQMGHHKYRLCSCGVMNLLDAESCTGCGAELRVQGAETDFSLAGRLSDVGLCAGVLGLVLLVAIPLVWSVDRSGLVWEAARSLLSVLGGRVVSGLWGTLVLVAGLVGVSLIYAQRWALIGGVACLTGCVMYVYAVLLGGGGVSLLPPILLGVCALLQFAQKIRQGATLGPT